VGANYTAHCVQHEQCSQTLITGRPLEPEQSNTLDQNISFHISFQKKKKKTMVKDEMAKKIEQINR